MATTAKAGIAACRACLTSGHVIQVWLTKW